MDKSPTTLISSRPAFDLLQSGKCIARYNVSIPSSSHVASPKKTGDSLDKFFLPSEVLKRLFMMIVDNRACILSIYRLGNVLFVDVGPEEALRMLEESTENLRSSTPPTHFKLAIADYDIDLARDLVSKNVVIPQATVKSPLTSCRSRTESDEFVAPPTNPFCPHPSSFIASGVPMSDFLDRKLLKWQTIDGTDVLVASKSTTFGLYDGGPKIHVRSHNLRDGNIVLSTLLDWYVENLVANVPQLGLVLHQDGIVRNFRLIPTDKISHLRIDASGDVKVEDDDACDGVFDHESLVIQASLLLKFIKERCMRDDGTYLLCKDKGNDGEYGVVDLNCTLEESRQRRWIWLLSMLNFRFAQRIGQYVAQKSNHQLEIGQTSVLVERQQRLLRNTLELLTQLRDMGMHYHSTISAAVCELLSDSHWNTAIDLRKSGSSIKSVLWELEQAEEALSIGMIQLDLPTFCNDGNDQSDESLVKESCLTLMTELVHKQIIVCGLHIRTLFNERVSKLDSTHNQDEVTFSKPSGYYSSILNGLGRMKQSLDLWVKLLLASDSIAEGETSRMQRLALLLQVSNIWELCRNSFLSLIDELATDNRFNWPSELDSGLYIEKIVDLMKTVDMIEVEHSSQGRKSVKSANFREYLLHGSYLLDCASYNSTASFESNLSMWRLSVCDDVFDKYNDSESLNLSTQVMNRISDYCNEAAITNETKELDSTLTLQTAFQRNEMIVMSAVCTDRIRLGACKHNSDAAMKKNKLGEFGDQCNEVGQSVVVFVRKYYDHLPVSWKLQALVISYKWLKLSYSVFCVTEDFRNIALVSLNIIHLFRCIAGVIVIGKMPSFYPLIDQLFDVSLQELSRVREVVLINDSQSLSSKKSLSSTQHQKQQVTELWNLIDKETANVSMTQGIELRRRLMENSTSVRMESVSLVCQLTCSFNRAIEIYERFKDNKFCGICHYNIAMVLIDIWSRRNDANQTGMNMIQVFSECSFHLTQAEGHLSQDSFYVISIKNCFCELILGLDPLQSNPYELKSTIISHLEGICATVSALSQENTQLAPLLNQIPKLIKLLVSTAAVCNDAIVARTAKNLTRIVISEQVAGAREERNVDFRNIISSLSRELRIIHI